MLYYKKESEKAFVVMGICCLSERDIAEFMSNDPKAEALGLNPNQN